MRKKAPKQPSVGSRLRKLWRLFNRREKVKTVGLLFLMVVAAMMEMVGIGAIPAFILVVASPDTLFSHPVSGPVLNWLNIETSRQLLVVGSVGLIGFFVMKGLLVAFINFVRVRFVQHKYMELSGRLFMYYMLAPYTFHLRRNSSELLRNVLNECSLVVFNVFLPVLSIALNAVTMVFIVGLLVVIEPFFSLVAMTLLGLLTYGIMGFVKNKTEFHGQKEQLNRQVSNKVVLEGLSGLKDARILGREDKFVKSFNSSIQVMARARFFIEMLQTSMRPAFETITVMGVLGLALVLTAKDLSMERIIAILALFAAATYRLMPTFNMLINDLNNLRYHIFSVTPVYNDLQDLKEKIEFQGQKLDKPMVFQSDIRLKGVFFSYPESDGHALKGIDLVIPRGKAIALVGESGAGKTTLVDAMLGLLRIDKGDIMVDGVDMYSDTRAWQQNVGYIPQFIFLADDSLKRNVAFGLEDKDIEDDLFWQAANAARLSDLIGQLPEKEHTLIGERGIRLSGGQRQRIGIARALYHNPQLLIMDEGTSALDNITEKYVIEAIDRLKGDRTIIMIAHRLTTVKNCDLICLMENGHIIDQGSYDELIARNKQFREMAGE